LFTIALVGGAGYIASCASHFKPSYGIAMIYVVLQSWAPAKPTRESGIAKSTAGKSRVVGVVVVEHFYHTRIASALCLNAYSGFMQVFGAPFWPDGFCFGTSTPLVSKDLASRSSFCTTLE
jgi:hypothetical protein